MVFREPVPPPGPNEFFELARSPPVQILVGKDEVAFSMPKDLLMYYSPYFKGCFGSGFKEAVEGVLRLPEDDPKHFEVLANYMRNGSAVYDCGEVRGEFELIQDNTFAECLRFIAFTDKYDLTQASTAIGGSFKACLAAQHLAGWMENEDIAVAVEAILSMLHPTNLVMRILADGTIRQLEAEDRSSDFSFVSQNQYDIDRKKRQNGVVRQLAKSYHNFAAALFLESNLAKST